MLAAPSSQLKSTDRETPTKMGAAATATRSNPGDCHIMVGELQGGREEWTFEHLEIWTSLEYPKVLEMLKSDADKNAGK